MSNKIQVGREIFFFAGYGGIDDSGMIVAVHGAPNTAPRQTFLNGCVGVIQQADCSVDVVLNDGRHIAGIRQCSIDSVGIGIKLRDRVFDTAAVANAIIRASRYKAHQAIAAAQARARFETAEAARVITDAPLFYWNGIKDAKGAKLQKCIYSDSTLTRYPAGTITIYARDYGRFSDKVDACFDVKNDTDTQVDYFADDTIRVIPTHPLYPQVKAALDASKAHFKRRMTKRRG